MTSPTVRDNYIFSKIGPEEAAAVAQLERRCFHLPWNKEQLLTALGQKAFAAFALKQDGVLVAYASVYHTAEELEILNIAVSPEHRRQGLARRLLGLVLREAGKMGIVRSVLEVRPNNAAAIALYAAHGYRQAGIRPGYYPDTGEDALIYAKELPMLIVAANWKMYKTSAEARATAAELSRLAPAPACEVVIFAPFTALAATAAGLTMPAALGGQDVYPAAEGAFTGEISPGMLQDSGCSWVLTGHSERRHGLGENPEFVGRKTAFALSSGLRTMLCIGETLEEREAGRLVDVLTRQTEAGLRDVSETDLAGLAVAYEPVWAIGTGKTATPDDIIAAHAAVRHILSALRGQAGRATPILYGGSVKPDNASTILALDNVGGLLVGGASLQAESFAAILRSV
jgi:triosephosphate isomerase